MLCKEKMNSNRPSIYLRNVLAIATVVLLNHSVALSQSHTRTVQGPADIQYSEQVLNSQAYDQSWEHPPVPAEYNVQVPAQQTTIVQSGSRDPEQSKLYCGADQFSGSEYGRKPSWRNTNPIPFESHGAGEYIGPSRTCLLYTSPSPRDS